MKNIGVFFFTFAICFLLVKDLTKLDTINEKIYGDNEYIYKFNEVTNENEQIVLFDNRGVENIRYHVIKFMNDEYIIYTYDYMASEDKYLEKYAELSSKIVDYKYSEYMIKTIEETGQGTYDDLMTTIINNNKDNLFYIVY